MTNLLTAPITQIVDINGDPLVGGKVYTYEAGVSLTPKAAYTDASGTTPLSNPVILDSNGAAAIWLTGSYRVRVTDADDVLLYDVDDIVTDAGGGALLNAVQTFTKAQRAAVTVLTSSSASIAIDLSASNNFSHTTTENTTLANPSNVVAGQSGAIMITQGASARTLAYGSYWKFPGGVTPSLTATPGAQDTLFYNVRSSTFIEANLIKGFA